MAAKVRKTVSLDPDVVDVFMEDPAGLSAAVNAALRKEMERKARAKALAAMVDDLNDRFGEPDPELVEEYARLLG
ncbi:MAG: BrnA antitoxin family protein [Bifidobacteriaceae bacterium]|jgi:cell division protein FtsB|nr:BrnA antitoxin family protein [Bifidobacteriaceae bacterium]